MNVQDINTGVENLDKIENLKKVLNVALAEGNQTGSHYHNLGMAYYKRYGDTDQQDDLETAVAFFKTGLDNCSSDTGYLFDLWNDLGCALKEQYEQLGKLDYLDETIIACGRALDLCPLGHHSRFRALNDLAIALWTRYGHLGVMEDLEKAIPLHAEALDLCPPGHLDMYMFLGNSALALQSRYEKLGEVKDLEQAVTYYEQALDLCDPTPSAELDRCLNNLGTALQNRYLELGDVEDLKRAVDYHGQALELCLPGHPNSFGSLVNLANALQTMFEQNGEMKDLEKAISCCEQALDLCPTNHPGKSACLNNLANSLQARYDQLGQIADLEKVIATNEQAMTMHPPDHILTSGSLNNLANALHSRYDQLGEMEDLERAISCHEKALNLHPAGHPDRSMSLNNLANALRTRYRHLGEIGDLEKTIVCHQEALELCPLGHHFRSISLHNLSSALQSRYDWLGDIQDLESSINYRKEALDSFPEGHPHRASTLNNLGNSFYSLYLKFENEEDLWRAITYHKRAAHVTSDLPNRLIGAKQWAIKAHVQGYTSTIPAYTLALELLQQHLALLPSITSQQKLIEKSSYLSLDAAAFAISLEEPETAIEFLEQGRSILWSKIQGYRQSIVDISEMAPHLAKEFQAVSSQLENNATSDGMDLTAQRALSEKWTVLLGEIRKLNGFSDFLKATSFNNLKLASAGGPVIMVNISNWGSDAIVLVSHGSPVIVPLPDVSPVVLEQLVHQLSNATTGSGSPQTIYMVLQKLWDAVVHPIVEQLRELGVPEKSHIWWCPTSYLCVLPLHAAGPYRKGSKNLPDIYISSYTPTLASLIRARSGLPKPQPLQSLLLVSQPDDTLPHVFEETEVINNFNLQVNSCSGYDADKKGVLACLQSHSWVHFACHGHLEAQPFNSWFQLYNGEHLTVLDLAKAHLPNAEFAFLSACHSAAGGVHGTLDESIHLAAALQFSGFRSVVGTLWAMVDDDGPSIANGFYRYMFRNSEQVDLKDAAAALNVATKELRKQGVPVDRWINFIHIGA